MGANAVTTVPVYVAGEVLTAADLNITNSGIPVFADSTARTAAFGGSGEKVLAEGQYAYLESDNSTSVYDGSNWVSVGTTPGLVCVKAETAFSAVANFTADSVFTSSYTNYKMIIRYETSSSQEVNFVLRAATVDAATNYNYQRFISASGSNTGLQSAGATAGYIGDGTNGSFTSSIILELSGPQLAAATSYQSQNSIANGAYTTPNIYFYYGNHSTATSYDGIKITTDAGNMTGTYAIYGYSKTA